MAEQKTTRPPRSHTGRKASARAAAETDRKPSPRRREGPFHKALADELIATHREALRRLAKR